MDTPNVAVFVSTCDAYRRAWAPFCHGWRTYWPDCPWPLYFLTNHLDAPCGTSLQVGPDVGWGWMQRRGLEMLDEPVVLLMHEDYWLTARPDVAALADFARIVQGGGADKILLVSGSHTSVGTYGPDTRLQVHAEDSKWRTATHGLWRRETLLALLRDDETPWGFEHAPPARSERYTILSVCKDKYWPHVPPPGALKFGRWTKRARVYVEREGLGREALCS